MDSGGASFLVVNMGLYRLVLVFHFPGLENNKLVKGCLLWKSS